MLRTKWDSLFLQLERFERILVAFSGGWGFSFLLAAAHYALGRENVLAVTAVSASLPELEFEATRRIAEKLKARHQIIHTDELNDPSYASNPSNRCFFCKDELFEKLTPIAREN